MSKYHDLMDEVHLTDEMKSEILENIASADFDNETDKQNDKVTPIRGNVVFRKVLPMVAAFILVFTGLFGFYYRNQGGDGFHLFAREETTTDQEDTLIENPAVQGSGNIDNREENTKTTDKEGNEIVKDESALESAVGYKAATVNSDSLPFDAKDTEYKINKDGSAEVVYSDGDQSVTIKKTKGTKNSSEETTKATSSSNASSSSASTTMEESTTVASATTTPVSENDDVASVDVTSATTSSTTTTTTKPTTTTTTTRKSNRSGTTTAYVDGVKVTMTGKNGKYNKATWTQDGYTYQIYTAEAVSYNEMCDMVRSAMQS